nr:hypothetical protein [Tanacetum cinerariifolium]GFB27717.1 hypothetical protein [Tanacetum cinerariifolium]
GADEGTSSILGVLDAPTDESEEELSWNFTDDEGADNQGKDGDDEEDEGDDGEEGDGDNDDEDDDGEEGNNDDADQEIERDDDKDDTEEGRDDDQEYDDEYAEENKDAEIFDPIPQTPKNSNDEGNGEYDLGLNFGGEEGHVEEDEEDELYRDVNINQRRGIQANLEVEDSHVTLTLVNPDGQQQSSSTPTFVALLPMSAPTMTPSTIATKTTTSQEPILTTTVLSNIIQNLPNFGSLFCFDDRLRSLEANFYEFTQTNQFPGVVYVIPGIVQRYMDQQMNEAVKVAVQIQSDRLCDEAQRKNEEFLKTVDENMQKIIKEQVKEQVKEKEPSVGPDRGSKRRREGKEPASASAPTETTTRSVGRSTQGSRSRQASASECALAEEPMQTTSQMQEPSHLEFDTAAKDQPIVQSS